MINFKLLSTRLAAGAFGLLPMLAQAGAGGNPLPEPGTWALVALAGAIGAVIVRNKRK